MRPLDCARNDGWGVGSFISTIAATATHNRVAPRHEGLMLLNQDDHDMVWRVAGIKIDASLCQHFVRIGMRCLAEALRYSCSPVP